MFINNTNSKRKTKFKFHDLSYRNKRLKVSYSFSNKVNDICWKRRERIFMHSAGIWQKCKIVYSNSVACSWSQTFEKQFSELQAYGFIFFLSFQTIFFHRVECFSTTCSQYNILLHVETESTECKWRTLWTTLWIRTKSFSFAYCLTIMFWNITHLCDF